MLEDINRTWSALRSTVTQFNILDIVDILIVTFAIFLLFRMVRGTRAMSVVKGIVVVFVFSRLAEMVGLQATGYALSYVLGAGAIVIVIVFQPEIRRALEQLGKGGFFGKGGAFAGESKEDYSQVVDEILPALLNMSKTMTGALIVLQGEQPLEQIADTGTRLDAVASQRLIENLFVKGAPLHDGAVLMQKGRIVAAGCFLPLTGQDLDRSLGTRHRAAVGVSEECDGTVFVVSEENGAISAAHKGQLDRNLDVRALRERLEGIYGKPVGNINLVDFFRRRGRNGR